MKKYDVIVVGGGVVGSAILRELSRYNITAALVEKESDLARGTSGKNSGVVHAGFNYAPGTKMAKFCTRGNQILEQVSKDLDIPYKKTGKLLVAFSEEDIGELHRLIAQGEKNGVKGLEYISAERVHALEPHIGGIGGMWSPNSAVINVFIYTIAMAENAVANGAEVYLDYEVNSIEKTDDGFVVSAADGRQLACSFVINAAGCYADKVAKLVGDNRFNVYPYKGEYLLLDKKAYEFCQHPIYPAPKPGFWGVHLTATEDNNILIGPSAEFVDDPSDVGTTKKKATELFESARKLLPKLQLNQVITSYAGMRSRVAKPGDPVPDFHIEYSEACNKVINLIGIESPGLTSAIPIAEHAVELLGQSVDLTPKSDFISKRKGIVCFRDLPLEEQEKLIAEDPDYGEIICRCESVTKREILDAIRNPLGVKNMTGIKMRSRASMGRCQGGYCQMRIVELLMAEHGLKPEEITYNNKDANAFVGHVK